MTDAPNPIAEPDRRVRWVLRSIVVLPMLVAAVRAVATGWFPVGDSALLAIRAADVGTSDHPLLGSWTSASLTLGVDVNNPGPLYPDLLAPFMWTLGRWFGIGVGVAIGVAALNAGFALATGWVGGRIGGWRVERWALLLVAALGWSMGSELLIDIWQPHALLLPFACFLMLTVGLIDEQWRLAPFWLGVASLLVQTHIGYVYVVAVFGVVLAVRGVSAARRASWGPGDVLRHRITAWGAAVVALAWIQPVIEQIFGEGRGNLWRLATNAGGGDVTIGASTSVKLVARVVALPPWWTRQGFEDSVVSTPLTGPPNDPTLAVPGLPSGLVAAFALLILVAVLVGITIALARRGCTAARSATAVSLIGVVAAVVTLAAQTVSVVGLGSHHVRWLWVLALFVQVSIAWGVVELYADRGRGERVVGIAIPLLTVVMSVANLGQTAHAVGPTADRAAADTLESTFDDLTSFDPGGAVRYDVDNLRPFEPWSSGVMMRLRELGIDVTVDDEGMVRQLGNGRRSAGDEATTIVQIERSAALDVTDVSGCVISTASPFDPPLESEIDTLIDDAAADLGAGNVELRLDDLEPELADRFRRALAGDQDEAFVLVADGVLAFMADDGRIERSSPAVDRAIEMADAIDRRVTGTLVLVADPPVGCE